MDFIAALGCYRLDAPCLIGELVYSDYFQLYLERVQLLTLRDGMLSLLATSPATDAKLFADSSVEFAPSGSDCRSTPLRPGDTYEIAKPPHLELLIAWPHKIAE